MIKKLIITMIAIAALTGVAIAADPQAPTMPFYWVTGKVLNPGQLNGRPVILYAKDYSDTKVISVIPDGSGNFTINTYELYFYHKNDNWVEIGGKPAFIVGVKRQNPDDYGTAEAATAIWDNGYLTIDLNLVVGGGPLEGASQIAGVVTAEANGDPIAGALLSEDSNGKSTVSGADGAYLFPGDFAAGSTVGVACSAVSYDSANKNTSPLVANQVTWVNFALAGGGIVDTGLIQGTDIIRVTDDKDSNIKITWGYKSGSGIVAADIWWLQGTYKEMSSNTNDWQPAPSGQNLSDGVTGWQAGNAVKVMDGNNAYYRIVPAGTVQAEILNPLNNSRTLGKVDLPLYKGTTLKFTRFSMPLIPKSIEWKNIIGDQLQANATPADADQILQWHGTGWNSLYYKSAVDGYVLLSGASYKFSFGEGYSLRVPGRAGQVPSFITIVGDVKQDQFSIASNFKNLAITKYTIFAHPFPKTYTLDNAGFASSGAVANDTPANADQINLWNGTGWVTMYLSTTGWQQLGLTSFQFVPTIGYTYRKGDSNTSSGFNWTLSPVY